MQDSAANSPLRPTGSNRPSFIYRKGKKTLALIKKAINNRKYDEFNSIIDDYVEKGNPTTILQKLRNLHKSV